MPAPKASETLDALGTMLRLARGDRSQKEIAATIGIVQSEVSAIECGSRLKIEPSLVMAIATAYGLDPMEVLKAAALREGKPVAHAAGGLEGGASPFTTYDPPSLG